MITFALNVPHVYIYTWICVLYKYSLCLAWLYSNMHEYKFGLSALTPTHAHTHTAMHSGEIYITQHSLKLCLPNSKESLWELLPTVLWRSWNSHACMHACSHCMLTLSLSILHPQAKIGFHQHGKPFPVPIHAHTFAKVKLSWIFLGISLISSLIVFPIFKFKPPMYVAFVCHNNNNNNKY